MDRITDHGRIHLLDKGRNYWTYALVPAQYCVPYTYLHRQARRETCLLAQKSASADIWTQNEQRMLKEYCTVLKTDRLVREVQHTYRVAQVRIK
jgi:hypothetical protein